MIWATIHGEGLVLYNQTNDKWISYKKEHQRVINLPRTAGNQIAEGTNGAKWIATIHRIWYSTEDTVAKNTE